MTVQQLSDNWLNFCCGILSRGDHHRFDINIADVVGAGF
jgi:hypothetical protein